MSIAFRPAQREQVTLVIGLAGASGGGKTYTAMRLASGIAGDKPFAVIDTENRRALHYADRFRFDHADLRAPFTPDAYAEAIAAADSAGYRAIVVDSFSHEWAGVGGMLDMQEQKFKDLGGREAVKMLSWVAPKAAHRKMMERLLQVRAHLIICLRAELKVDMVDDPQNPGKKMVVAKKTLAGFEGWIPICEKNLPFELTCSFLLLPDKPGVPRPIKLQEQHKHLFPLGVPITEASGLQLAEWAAGGDNHQMSQPVSRQADASVDREQAAPATGHSGSAPTPAGTSPISVAATDELRRRVRLLLRSKGPAGLKLLEMMGLSNDTWERADIAALTDLFNALNKVEATA